MTRKSGLNGSAGWRRTGSGHARGTAIVAVLLVFGVILVSCGGSEGGERPQVPAATTTQPVPVATISTDPVDHSVGISPVTPITVTAGDGTLERVALLSPEGVEVSGHTAPDGVSWQSSAPLGYDKTYTISATAKGADGLTVTRVTRFTTIEPSRLAYPSMNPLDGQTVGVGQPLAIYFDEPIANKQVAEDSIIVTTDPPVEGAFYWFSDNEVHWRPQSFWAPGTQVTADIQIYGKDLGNRVFGQENRTIKFTTGDSFIARADGATHQMTVEINGRIVRTMPISMGGPDFPSNNGVHVVTERHPSKVMDSTTFGLALGAGGYITEVKWATRISDGGEFVHSAPWSVSDQGNRNVSHGCINLAPENAKWFFDTVKKGDVVINTNTGGPGLRAGDGLGDWQIPWGEWLTGGRV